MVIYEAEPVMQLAKSWNLCGQQQSFLSTERMTACRWRHSLRALPDTTMPTNKIKLAMAGSRALRLRGGRAQSASLARGGISIIPEGNYGSWRYEDELDVFHFYISNVELSRLASEEGLQSFSHLRENLRVDDPVLGMLAHEVALACMEGEEGSLYSSTLGVAMGLRVLRSHSNLSFYHSANQPNHGLAPWQLNAVIDAMRSDVASDPNLADLARIARLSPFHFARAFKMSTGVPPHRYLVLIRIERVRALLETTDLPIGDISAQVGYDDPSYLAWLFRREVGLTPVRYRREQRL